jgi:hypothetical protein
MHRPFYERLLQNDACKVATTGFIKLYMEINAYFSVLVSYN